jgi:hypothetical protein
MGALALFVSQIGARITGVVLLGLAAWFVAWSIRSRKRGGPLLEFEGDRVTLRDPPGLTSPLVADVSAIREVIIDASGARVGADRVRFPVTDFASESKFYAGDRGGSELVVAVPEGRHPNAAFVFDSPRVLPARRVDDRGETTVSEGFAVELADPRTAAEAMRGTLPVRVIPPRTDRNVSHDAREVWIVGKDDHVETRAHRIGSLVALVALFGAIGFFRARAEAGDGMGWIGLAALIAVGATFGFVRARWHARRTATDRPAP